MKMLSYVILFCVACAVLETAIRLVVVGCCAMLVAGLLFKTKKTLTLISIAAAICAIQAHPAIGIGSLVGLFPVVALTRWLRSNRR